MNKMLTTIANFTCIVFVASCQSASMQTRQTVPQPEKEYVASAQPASMQTRQAVPQPEKEYAYLGYWLCLDRKWGPYEYYAFLYACKDKHLVEIAFLSDVKGITQYDADHATETLQRYGGRAPFITLIQKDMLWDSSALVTYPISSLKVPYHDLVTWTTKAAWGGKLSDPFVTTAKMERSLIEALFVSTWDKLSPEQRKHVFNNTKLSELSPDQTAAIVGASGLAALAIFSGTVALSGFAFYQTMSSVMCASAGVLGITLPFAASYGATSTVVGVMSGPVGWTAMGIGAASVGLWSTRANYAKTAQNIIAIAIVKAKAVDDLGWSGP